MYLLLASLALGSAPSSALECLSTLVSVFASSMPLPMILAACLLCTCGTEVILTEGFPEVSVRIAVTEEVSFTWRRGNLVALVSVFTSSMPVPMSFTLFLFLVCSTEVALAEGLPQIRIGVAVIEVVSTARCQSALVAHCSVLPGSMVLPMRFAFLFLSSGRAESIILSTKCHPQIWIGITIAEVVSLAWR